MVARGEGVWEPGGNVKGFRVQTATDETVAGTESTAQGRGQQSCSSCARGHVCAETSAQCACVLPRAVHLKSVGGIRSTESSRPLGMVNKSPRHNIVVLV